jgi:hypothetical protein
VDLLTKPHSEQTSILHIKNFSPFARAYSSSLQKLPSPIPRDTFLSFIDGLNAAFLSAPVFQAANIIGGGLMGSQIPPAQLAGGVVQILSVIGSAGVSIVRVKRYLKKSTEEIFKPRGLCVRIMGTKKMMGAVGCENVDAKGKLALPAPGVLGDLTPPPAALPPYQGGAGDSDPGDRKEEVQVEDPRVRRLKALEGFIAPLEFEKEAAPTRGPMDKYGGAPLRWLNKKQDAKLLKAATKSAEHRRKNTDVVEEEFLNCEAEIRGIEERMAEIRVSAKQELEGETRQEGRDEVEARVESELAELEGRRTELEMGRDERVREVYKKGDKKLNKLAKKEEKIANRILWVVITRMDGSVGDDLVDVESLGG